MAASNTAISCGFHLSVRVTEMEMPTQHDHVLILLLRHVTHLLGRLTLSLRKTRILPHYSSSCSGHACPGSSLSPPSSDAPIPAVTRLAMNTLTRIYTSSEDTNECLRHPVASSVGAKDKWKCLHHASAKTPTILAAAFLAFVARLQRRHF